MRSAALVVLLAAAPLAGALAQSHRRLEPGQPVRVSLQCAITATGQLRNCQSTPGRLVSLSNDSLVFEAPARTAVARERILRIEVRGRSNASGPAALLGALVGSVVGGVKGLEVCNHGTNLLQKCSQYRRDHILGAVLGALGGGLLGEGVGRLIPRQGWVEVHPLLNEPVGVTPVVTPGGVGLGLRF